MKQPKEPNESNGIKHLWRVICFRVLKKSFIFKYWHKKFLTEVIYDLEIDDLEDSKRKYIMIYRGLYEK